MNLKNRLETGQSVIGAFVNLRSPDAAELMSQSGFDFLLVDAEHSSIGPEGILEMFRAIERGRAIPLLRVPETSAAGVQWALDAGARGILFPRIRSVDDVQQAVSLCRYPPEGNRGLGPGRASGYGANLLDYATTANSEIMVMIQVETMEAVEQIDEIAAVPGVDLIFIGPGDLSQLLGVTGELHHPRIQEIGKRVVTVLPRKLNPCRHTGVGGRNADLLESTRCPTLCGRFRRGFSRQIVSGISGPLGAVWLTRYLLPYLRFSNFFPILVDSVTHLATQ